MSEDKFRCGCPKDFYEKELAEAEDWEINRKKKMQKILAMDKDPECPGHKKLAPGEYRSTWVYSTGGIGETYLACPKGCGQMYKKVTKYGDEKELKHECQQSSSTTTTTTTTERERERERESKSSLTLNKTTFNQSFSKIITF